MNKKQATCIYSVLAFLTIWCTWNTVKSGNLISTVYDVTSNYNLLEREVAHTIDRLSSLELKAPEVIIEKVDTNELLRDVLNK